MALDGGSYSDCHDVQHIVTPPGPTTLAHGLNDTVSHPAHLLSPRRIANVPPLAGRSITMPSNAPCCPVSQEPYEADGPNKPRSLPCGHSISHDSLDQVSLAASLKPQRLSRGYPRFKAHTPSFCLSPLGILAFGPGPHWPAVSAPLMSQFLSEKL